MEPKQVIFTGGNGYLGRCVARIFHGAGFAPVLVDNFSTSRRPAKSQFPLHEVELTDLAATRAAWAKIGAVHGVIHFAARALVPESVRHPELYYRNNLLAVLNVAEVSLERKVPHFVHSSSCAVYGIPTATPIPETHPCQAITPYGESKRMAERILNDLAEYRGLNALNLRYFNPAGALADGSCGEAHEPETHLIPNIVRAALAGKAIPVYGKDYSTPDGTCVRDFIHVEDLAEAHLAALRFLERPDHGPALAINVGSGQGYSVLEIIHAAERVFERPLPIEWHPRRPGDPPVLVAESALATRELAWKPTRSLEAMIRSHLAWEKTRSA